MKGQNYKMLLAYDGAKFDGWQKQGNTENTIQGRLEMLLSKMTGKTVELAGAGRTDAGVHAMGQVMNVFLDTEKNEEEIQEYMNRYLPEDIAVLSVEKAAERFHSRLNAAGKYYLYRIHNDKVKNPFTRKYCWHIPEKLDMASMKTAAALLTGTHDFRGFCSNKRIKKSTVRTIYHIKIWEESKEIKLEFYGNGFLYHMVRIITGTLVEIGKGELPPEKIEEILKKKDRQLAGITAPAHGLCLQEVKYE